MAIWLDVVVSLISIACMTAGVLIFIHKYTENGLWSRVKRNFRMGVGVGFLDIGLALMFWLFLWPFYGQYYFDIASICLIFLLIGFDLFFMIINDIPRLSERKRTAYNRIGIGLSILGAAGIIVAVKWLS